MITLNYEDAELAAQIISYYIEENQHHLSEMEDDEPQLLLDEILSQLGPESE
jgi:hypothetical protein